MLTIVLGTVLGPQYVILAKGDKFQASMEQLPIWGGEAEDTNKEAG